MSDSQEFFNAYLENSISVIHDYLNQTLQLKTQLKLVTKLLTTKDEAIQNLTNELNGVRQQLDTITTAQGKDNEMIATANAMAKRLQDENDSIRQKVSQFDVLVKQFNELKTEFKNKEDEIQKLTEQLTVANTDIANKISIIEGLEVQIKEKNKPVLKTDSSSKKTINNKTTTVYVKDEDNDF